MQYIYILFCNLIVTNAFNLYLNRENICIKRISDYNLLPISTCDEYVKYKSIIDGELFNIKSKRLENVKSLLNNNLVLKSEYKEKKKENYKFNNLTNNSRLKFMNWLNNLPVDKLHENHIKEIRDFTDLSMNISNYIIVITKNELVLYAVLGDVSNDLLNIKSIFRNHGLANNNYSFLNVKEDLVEYLNNCTSDIKDINLEYVKKSSYKRYILSI